MSDQLIVPDQLPDWVPGHVTVRSPDQGWHGVSVRGYRYTGLDVHVPAMRDYMIVAYRRGGTAMTRKLDGDWSHAALGPGDVSLLTRASDSHWIWPNDIEVVHVYLTQDELATTCRQMYEREVADVELHDVLKADDPAIHRTAMMIAVEAAHGAVGSRLLVESLTCQLAVHILRRHADVHFKETRSGEGLTTAQLRLVDEYLSGNLTSEVSLRSIAAAVGLSRHHFARQFRAATGSSVHDYVLERRLERARILLRRTRIPLRDVAAQCGFADQSHMTRIFRQRLDTTPARYRQDS
jgi:AraC family transcriptional regulator